MEKTWLITYRLDAHAQGVDIARWKEIIDRVTPVLPNSTILTVEGTRITVDLMIVAVDTIAALRLADKGLKRSMRRMGFSRALDEIFVKVTIGNGALSAVPARMEDS